MSVVLVLASAQDIRRKTDAGNNTVTFWFKVTALPSAATFSVLADCESDTSEGVRFRVDSAGQLSMIGRISSSAVTGSTISTGVWYFGCITTPLQTGSADSYRFYLNSVLDITKNDWGCPSGVNTMNVRYGNTVSGAESSSAKFGYTRQWASILNTTEMAAEQASATAVKASSLYDVTLVSAIGSWTADNSPTFDTADNPSFGGGSGSFRNFYGSKFYGTQYAPRSPMEHERSVACYYAARAAEMRRFMDRVERRAA